MPRRVILETVDISHARLPELVKLADLAEPFYRWAESVFREVLKNHLSLSENLLTVEKEKLIRAIKACYSPSGGETNLPSIFDGVGRKYSHRKACFYFFSWLMRDAPQQRLAPLINRAITRAGASGVEEKVEIEIRALGELIIEYRNVLKSFTWDSIREVIYDRLEGSRRSIKGHEKEILIRTALVEAIQNYYKKYSDFGIYQDVEIFDKQVRIGTETFDVSVRLKHKDPKLTRLILLPVKTRETEGGGHSHIFTRDINSAIDASKQGADNYVVAFIIAQNWAEREQQHVAEICDLAIFVSSNPNEFDSVPEDAQEKLNRFIKQVMTGEQKPKRWEEIRGLLENKEGIISKT